MRDIWNPWHGCRKCSEGCQNCYMFFLDKRRNLDGGHIYRTKTAFSYPISRDRSGQFKVKSGETLRVCMTSDFFLEEADPWRMEAWEIIRQRPDVIFFLLTKRPERVLDHLPPHWHHGWENVMLSISCENQRRADERIPHLLSLPFRHKGVMCAPLIGPIVLGSYLSEGVIEQVLCDGENYDGARPCHYDWVKSLYDECRAHDVTFRFFGTGQRFVKDGRLYCLDIRTQREQARKSGLIFEGKPVRFQLHQPVGQTPGLTGLEHLTFHK